MKVCVFELACNCVLMLDMRVDLVFFEQGGEACGRVHLQVFACGWRVAGAHPGRTL